MKKPQYIIVAGVNGAGKSTLYDAYPDLFVGTERLNADEILKQMGGDWHKDTDNLKAMRVEIKRLHAAINRGKNIHVETTLAGHAKTQINLIEKAHQNGYEVTLLYVSVNSAETAIKRVNERVEKGGHGIKETLVQKRYKQSNANLPKVDYYADNVRIYDNTDDFINVYTRENDLVKIDSLKFYPWINVDIN